MNARRSARVPWFSQAARLSVLLVGWSIVALGAQAPSSSQAIVRPLPDSVRFLQQFRSTLQSDSLLLSRYTYREKRTDVRLNDEGEITGRSVKVFEVYPAAAGAESYRRLISVDGLPVDRDRLDQCDRERRDAMLEDARQLAHENPSQREKRLRSETDARRKESEIIDEAFRLYDFRMIGRERIDGYDAIRFTFSPAPAFAPRTSEGKLLQKFSGRAWVAESDQQLIRVEIEAIDDVSMGFGFLARFDKGSQVVVQRRKVGDTVWLPAEFRYSVGGRVLLVKKLRIEGAREYSDFRAAGAGAPASSSLGPR